MYIYFESVDRSRAQGLSEIAQEYGIEYHNKVRERTTMKRMKNEDALCVSKKSPLVEFRCVQVQVRRVQVRDPEGSRRHFRSLCDWLIGSCCCSETWRSVGLPQTPDSEEASCMLL